MPTYRTVVNITWGAAGSPGVNTFHYRTGAGADEDLVLADAGEALQLGYQLLRTQAVSNVVWSWDGTWVDVDSNEERVAGAPWTVTGNSTSPNSLPHSQAVCLTLRTTSRTRAGTGRVFFGPLSVLALDPNGTPTATVLQAVNNFGALMIEAGTGGSGAFVVYSRTQGLARDIVSTRARDIFAVLRSRRD